MKAEENLKTKATCAQMQYLQKVQRILSQLKQYAVLVWKKIKRDVVVTLLRKTSRVGKAKCRCPTGASSYCNHIMALLFKIGDYSLKDVTEVPQEVSCTSQVGM